MTPAEIITEINKLPPGEWEKIKESVDAPTTNGDTKAAMTEEEFARHLFAKGIIGNIPDLSKLKDEDDEWEPVEIEGRPTSELIIEDRR